MPRAWMKLIRILALAAPLACVSASMPIVQGCGGGGSGDACCKHCSTGKPCGDTCIAVTDTCHTTGGCACK